MSMSEKRLLRLLGKLGDKRAVLPLIEALKDEDEDVRKEAAEALGELEDKRAVVPLIEALKDEDVEMSEKRLLRP